MGGGPPRLLSAPEGLPKRRRLASEPLSLGVAHRRSSGGRRIRKGGGLLEDARTYWLFGVRDERLSWGVSSPDPAGLLREFGQDDPLLAREAFIALHRDAEGL